MRFSSLKATCHTCQGKRMVSRHFHHSLVCTCRQRTPGHSGTCFRRSRPHHPVHSLACTCLQRTPGHSGTCSRRSRPHHSHHSLACTHHHPPPNWDRRWQVLHCKGGSSAEYCLRNSGQPDQAVGWTRHAATARGTDQPLEGTFNEMLEFSQVKSAPLSFRHTLPDGT